MQNSTLGMKQQSKGRVHSSHRTKGKMGNKGRKRERNLAGKRRGDERKRKEKREGGNKRNEEEKGRKFLMIMSIYNEISDACNLKICW